MIRHFPIAALTQQRRETEAEFRQKTLDDLSQARQKAAELEQEQVKATQKTGLQTLRAPVDGTVEQLSVHTVGGVVTPAQALMVVVPEGSGLEVEAMLPNREVGFVHAGQPAEVKVEAFTFTRYGLLHGTVEGVSRDAVQTSSHKDRSGHDRPSDAGAGEDEPDAANGGSAYVARVALAQTSVETDNTASFTARNARWVLPSRLSCRRRRRQSFPITLRVSVPTNGNPETAVGWLI